MMSLGHPQETKGRVVLRGVLWLFFLGPFFFISYGFSNAWTAQYGQVGSVVFDWEHHIPFVPWTILPYWSIDLLYGLAFLTFRNRGETDTYAWRLLTVQLICITCFFLVPLRFTFDRPETTGLWGALFSALAGFDKPFNQAPSLHIALLLIIWLAFVRAARGFWRPVVHVWALLIGVSVLTTYQHHFVDVPTGALAGCVALWLWPDHGAMAIRGWRWTGSPRRRTLALRYLGGAGLLAFLAGLGGWALWLAWPAFSLAMVGFFYFGPGGEGFQKCSGRMSVAVRALLAPYRLGAWINSRLWTLQHTKSDEIAPGVWLGRVPTRQQLRQGGFTAVLDLCPELQVPKGAWQVESRPWLDLMAPSPGELQEAVSALQRLCASGPVLVCCALGYSRSASAVAAWLLYTGQAPDLPEAVKQLRRKRPRLVLRSPHLRALQTFIEASRRER